MTYSLKTQEAIKEIVRDLVDEQVSTDGNIQRFYDLAAVIADDNKKADYQVYLDDKMNNEYWLAFNEKPTAVENYDLTRTIAGSISSELGNAYWEIKQGRLFYVTG